jgi:hypothetical protein
MVDKVQQLNDNPIITKNDLYVLWQKSRKVKGITTWLKYIFYYDKYKRLANFGATVISEYQIPYGSPSKLYDKDKE